LKLYGLDTLDYSLLQKEVLREKSLLEHLEREAHALRIKTVRPLYRRLHPSRHLETIPWVGQEGEAFYACFIGKLLFSQTAEISGDGEEWFQRADRSVRQRERGFTSQRPVRIL
jgi:hypothetical protein